MNINHSYTNAEVSINELICDLELDSIINAINKCVGVSMFSGLIKDMAIRTKGRLGKERLLATTELKETFHKMINCFPPDLIEKHHLHLSVDLEKSNERHLREHYPDHIHRQILDLPSNNEIEQLWKTKRQERKALQEQIVSGAVSLKRKGVNGDVVELICKKMKH